MVFSLWEFAGHSDGSVFVSPFSATVLEAAKFLTQEGFWGAFAKSNEALLVGVPLALIIGFPIGFALGRVRPFDRAAGFLLDVMLTIPMVAIVPVVIVALGLTLSARVAVVFFFAVPLAALYGRAAVRVVDRELIEMAQSFGASRLQVWTRVILPSSTASLFVGLRLAVAHGISGMIVIELTLIPAGLGDLLLTYKSQFSSDQLFAATLLIGLEGFVVLGLIEFVRRRIIRGRRIPEADQS